MDQTIRKPSVAGRFYPGSPKTLAQEISKYLREVPDSDFKPKRIYGLISPHAGYTCSAPTAAYGYKLLRQYSFRRAVVISPSHNDYFNGVSIYNGNGYETPLGVVDVDRELCSRIVDNCRFANSSDVGHRSEHALEVQLPFLQTIYPNGFELVPITVGVTTAKELEEFSDILAKVVDPQNTVIIASSDLSHYYPQAMAHRKDEYFINLLEKYDLDVLASGYDDQSLEACGLGPILVLMNYARKIGHAACRSLDYRTSGDTCADKLQVVGYTSTVVYE